MKNINKISILSLAGVLGLTGCSLFSSPPPPIEPQPKIIVTKEKVPGEVDYVWEEPMVDVIDVPPGLDPDGVYYRPGHQETVEVRQGKWRYYRPKEAK